MDTHDLFLGNEVGYLSVMGRIGEYATNLVAWGSQFMKVDAP